jgi:hypothetical protein
MFFKLSRQPDPQFPQHHELQALVLSTDQGWHRAEDAHKIWIYKGYLDRAAWSADILNQLDDHAEFGNFMVFEMDRDSGNIRLKTNRWRGVLIWNQPDVGFSNLFRGDYTVWNDSSITIAQDLTFQEQKLDILGHDSTAIMSRAQVVDSIHTILRERTGSFLSHNHLPLKVFCSGGVDSTLVWSYVKTMTDDFELVLENRVQWDQFWCRNRKHITREFWGYQQIHHWLDPCVLTSGAPGDEFMLRSPTTTNLWCMYQGLDIFDLLHSAPSLHAQYFLQPKHQELFRNQQQDPGLHPVMRLSRPEFVRYLCNIVVNDCQHWHLGNTLTWTPLRDLRVFRTLLNLENDHIISQMLHSDVSLELIAKNDQALLSVMSDIKNVGESLSNLAALTPR